MRNIFSLLMAFIGYTILSSGFVLMKKGIKWIGWKGEKDKIYYHSLFIWLTGFILTNIGVIPNAIALNKLPPYIVSSVAGWGIIIIVLLSYILLKEKLYKSDLIYSFLIVTGITLINYFAKEFTTVNINYNYLALSFSIPILLFTTGFIKKISKKGKSIIFASCGGFAAGLMIIFIKLIVNKYGYNIKSYFSSIYLYAYLFEGLFSFISFQLAYKKGEMILVGPLQYSSNILYPLFVSILVFNQHIALIQLISIFLIVFSVIKILLKH